MRFKDKTVMLSGAASGIGRLAVEKFAAEGAHLSLADIDADGLAETAATLGDAVLTTRVDVSAEADHVAWVAATRDRFGAIDIALNNAGVIHGLGRITDTPVEEFDRMMAINARGVFLALKTQIPVMVDQRAGCILNTASVAGLIGAGLFGAYVASKHAVVGLTRTAADEYARYGLRINALCPAFTESPMLEGIADELKKDEAEAYADTYARVSRGLPMRRVGRTEEIVDAMMLICDPANTFMTGQAIPVDGGLTAI